MSPAGLSQPANGGPGRRTGIDSGELFLYAGKGHLFVDKSLSGYDETGTKLVLQRVLVLLS